MADASSNAADQDRPALASGQDSGQKPHKPRRRWLQFSIRAVLLGVGVLCLWLAWRVHTTRQQDEAIDRIEELGGHLGYDYQVQEGPHGRTVDPRAAEPWPEWCRPVAKQLFPPEVVVVELSGKAVTDDDVRLIARLTRLKSLGLSSTQITDAALRDIGELSELESLSLRNTRISDRGLESLAQLPRLKQLNLGETQVTDVGLRHLKSLPLRSLVLHHLPITDAGVRELIGLSQLTNLSLDDTLITDAALVDLGQMTQLQEWLGLCGTRITAAGLPALASLKNIEVLNLRMNPPLSRAAVKELQAALPQTRISASAYSSQ